MWGLIIERAIYLRTAHRQLVGRRLGEWEARREHGSWYAIQRYRASISDVALRLRAGVAMITALAAICPLLGLLGTVAGMIQIFDAMAFAGSSSPRAVAAGVSTATISTMAGMVGALSGVFGGALLSRSVSNEISALHRHEIVAGDIRLSRLTSVPGALRVLCSALAAATVTLGLLFLMQGLIVTGESAITEVRAVAFVDFVRVRQAEEVRRKEQKPDKPQAPEPQPAAEVRPPPQNPDTGIVVSMSRPDTRMAADIRIGAMGGFGMQDADYLPIVKVLPLYPRIALSQGLSGWVMLRFTITVSGSVTDIEVVESSHAVFERPAIRAAAKFKYKPRVINGNPVEVHGVLHKIVFELAG